MALQSSCRVQPGQQTSRRSIRASLPSVTSMRCTAHFTAHHQQRACAVQALPQIALTTSPRSTSTRAVATAASPATTDTATKWYALVASAEFFFNDVQNEGVAEQMRERLRFLQEQGLPRDFHFVPEPKWLDAKFPAEAKRVNRPCVALVASNKSWILFMKLRLDRVMRFDLVDMTEAEALAVGGKVPEFKPPAKWTAPYPPYSSGWWEKFLPGAVNKA